MGTMIQQYQSAKREHDDCAAWAALIGKKYNGGGGGIGATAGGYGESDEGQCHHEHCSNHDLSCA